ncbi:uncharacterized protein EHS24_006769 [Apiotrichum porosum]|uniref:HMG box domain-containing protein n=1 Tax=Apiotrichum porosum TaxID=105984 RepID=A0A427XW98_9TREE|nr:uncharacterized protein EHS24_006769 [Apiotrichum porosum]RSH83112.1 hypothetical protein EHS24_006769 [Apiotrichum porosum]
MALNIVRSTGIPAIARANAVRAFSSSPAVSMAARAAAVGKTSTAAAEKKKADAAQLKEKAKAHAAKEKEKEKAKAAAAKEKEKVKAAAAKQKEKEKAKAAKQKEKEKGIVDAEKKKLADARAKEKATSVKEKEDRSTVKALLAAAPKRPATPYLVYFTEFWSTNKGTYKTAEGNYKNTAGGTTLTEAVKDASAKWLVMSEAEQAKYREAASDAAAKYARDYRRFYESLTPENLKLIAKVQGKEPAPPGGRRAAKLELRNRPGNPGKPSGAYFMFLKDKRAEIEAANPNWTGNERMLKLSRAAGDMWRNLPQADKDAYKEKNAVAKEAYDAWVKTQE